MSRARPNGQRHAHEFYELVFVAEGHAEHVVAGESYPIGTGDLFLVDIGSWHCYSSRSDDFTVVNCLFVPTFLSEVAKDDSAFSELARSLFLSAVDRPDKPIFVRAGGVPEARSTVEQMMNEFQAKKPGYIEVIQALLKVLLICVLRVPEGTPPRNSRLVDEIIAYVNAAAGKKLCIGEISQAVFFSPAYIGRVFREATGVPLSRFIAEKRMENVCRLLETTDLTIESILSETGYSDKKNFYEQFVKRYNCTPGEYRLLFPKDKRPKDF